MKKYLFSACILLLSTALFLSACGGASPDPLKEKEETPSGEQSSSRSEAVSETVAEQPVTILVAAAASLEYSFVEKLIPMFEQQYPHITVEGTYDSSGKLLTQIEEGLEADLFMSASTKEMAALQDKGQVDRQGVVELLENRIVLIAPVDSNTDIASFQDIPKAQSIALGDPESVPVGRYSKEALTNLGIFDGIQSKVSYGTNVTEVLNWVAESSAEVGIVYATDAAQSQKVKILAEAPAGSLEKKVIYPVSALSQSQHLEQAQLFVDFLSSSEALAVFESYGFTPNQ